MNRWRDWWEQSSRDLAHAKHALDDDDFEWAAFAAQQAAEKALKAGYPNGFADGYPGKLYTKGESEQAIADATTITEFCRGHLPG